MKIRAIAYLTAVLGVAAFNTQANTLFDELDLNKDGFISEVEAAANSKVTEVFEELDTNEDGQISKDEFAAFEG